MNVWTRCATVLVVALTVTAASCFGPVRGARVSRGASSELFDVHRVWRIDLSLSEQAWADMQPHVSARRQERTPWSRYLGPEGGRNGVAAARGIDVDYVHADLSIDGRAFHDVGVRFKGQGTLLRARGDKRSLKIQFDRYDGTQRLAGIRELDLQSSVTDPGFMNEALAFRLYRDAGVPAPRTGYARVSVSVGARPAEYLGLYVLLENYDPALFAGHDAPPGGAILKPSLQRPFEYLGDDWGRYRQSYDPKTHLSEAQQRRVIEFARFVSDSDDEAFAARLGDYLDLDEFARYFAVLAWLGNVDSLLDRGQNYFVYLRPDDRRLMFLPWDQDGSFGNFGWRWGDSAAELDVRRPWTQGIRFLDRVMAVPAVRSRYFARLREFGDTLFVPARFARQIGELAPVIRPAVAEESAALAIAFDTAARGEAGILPFVGERARNVTGQMAGIPLSPGRRD